MAQFTAVLDTTIGVLRVGFLAIAAVLAVVCALDWMVRTRRISPFSGMARFARSTIDPLIAPVERRVVRAGGLPTAAPLWALGAAVLGGILVLSLLGFLRGQLIVGAAMSQGGARGVMALVVSWMFLIMRVALLVRVISSWIRGLSYSKWVRWAHVLTEPLLSPLRKIIPSFGMIDITPILAYFGLSLLEGVIVGAIAP